MDNDPPNPNMRDPDTGLYCFLNESRVCNASCMAFLNPVPPGPDYLDQQWANCSLLVNAHRTGKHLTIIAQVTGESVKAGRTAAADAARLSQPTPPPPVAPR